MMRVCNVGKQFSLAKIRREWEGRSSFCNFDWNLFVVGFKELKGIKGLLDLGMVGATAFSGMLGDGGGRSGGVSPPY